MTTSLSTRLRTRDGFALPMAILIIAVLTLGLAAGLAANTADAKNQLAMGGNERALVIAQSALERFLSNRSGICAVAGASCASDPFTSTSPDSVRVTYTNGFADIVSTRIRDTAGTNTKAVFFIRSRGVDLASGAGSKDSAEHTVGVYATMNTMAINVVSAVVSLTGIQKNGNSGTVSGVDQCGGGDTLAGLSVPTGDYSGSTSWASGKPPIQQSSLSTLENSLGFDWNSVEQGSISADYTIPGQSFPSASWFAANPTAYPTIRVKNNPGSTFSLPNAGRGLLIVDGDFAISGSNMWDGVILIGGSLTSNGSNTMSGATVSGLNKLLGQNPDTSVIGTQDDATYNGNKIYVYNSCSVSKASSGIRTYKAMYNTWSDNVTSW